MQEADHILITLLDGTFALAQVARVDQGLAFVLLSDKISAPSAKPKAIPADDIIASVVVATDALSRGQWPVIGYEAVPRIARYRDIALPDADPTEPAIAEALANALHGLYPWDGFPDPEFFTSFLRSRDRTPQGARMTRDFPKPDT